MLAKLLLAAIGIFGGAMLAVQAGVNAQLARLTGTPLLAAMISFVIGLVVLLVAAAALRVPPPPLAALREAHWSVWTGGLLGTAYLLSAIWLAPRLGATALVAAVITGQLATALLLDQLGAAGFPERAATPGRLAGVALLGIGLFLILRR